MAKGFTVKAKTPESSQEPEWDYNKAREMVRGKSIVFCLPGRGVSYTYLKNFVQLCFDLVQSGASIQISQDYSSMVNFARCKCLGANVLRGPDQILGMGNYSMIGNFGLTLTLYSIQRSFGNLYLWIRILLQVGMQLRMVILLLLLIG